MGDVEINKCSICGTTTQVSRKYYYYCTPCECHGNQHFEIVYHCSRCTPVEPRILTIKMKPSLLNTLIESTGKIYEEFEQYKRESIKWDKEDFIGRAKERGLTITPEKAQEALERMIRKHDANEGIHWITIDCYLDEYCEPKKEENENKKEFTNK